MSEESEPYEAKDQYAFNKYAKLPLKAYRVKNYEQIAAISIFPPQKSTSVNTVEENCYALYITSWLVSLEVRCRMEAPCLAEPE